MFDKTRFNIGQQNLMTRQSNTAQSEEELYVHAFASQIIADNLAGISKNFKRCYVNGLYLSHSSLPFAMQSNFYTDEDSDFYSALTNSFDLIISNLSLHYANDVVGALIQYCKALSSSGLFICNILGENTLHELRQVMIQTDLELFGRAYQRMIPLIEIKQLGSLLQRAGFSIPHTVSNQLIVEYRSLKQLLQELKLMNFGNYTLDRSTPFHRHYFTIAEETYRKNYGEKGRLPATFNVITAFGSV